MVEMMLDYIRYHYSDNSLLIERVLTRRFDEIEINFINPNIHPQHRILCVNPQDVEFLNWQKVYLRKKKINKIKI